MLSVIIINILILSGAVACLVLYLTSPDIRVIRNTAYVLSAVSSAGLAGAAVCAFFVKNISAVLVISAVVLIFLAVLMLCFAVARRVGAAVIRLCLAPMWSMLVVLMAYAAYVICGDPAAGVFGYLAALGVFVSPACDFYRLSRRMRADDSISADRISSAKKRRAANAARKNAAQKRKKLMGKKSGK